jgi:hypothetical protein
MANTMLACSFFDTVAQVGDVKIDQEADCASA